jgi:hypothetical protein
MSDADGGGSGAHRARCARRHVYYPTDITLGFGDLPHLNREHNRFAHHHEPWQRFGPKPQTRGWHRGFPANLFAARSGEIAGNRRGGSRLVHLAEVVRAPLYALTLPVTARCKATENLGSGPTKSDSFNAHPSAFDKGGRQQRRSGRILG